MYQQGGKGMQIDYRMGETALGCVLVAATERGVTAVRFGETEATLEVEFAQEYPQAQRVRDEQGLRPWVTLLLHYLQGQPLPAEVPLDVTASTFQWKVWKALQAIPLGSTRSYREIAQAIGAPTAARAVAQAWATNPVALFIPCHRVIRSNGELGGYHWGLVRKQQLLALEQAHATPETQHQVSLLSTEK
jgi:AraC family transcriptional regulator, regulatory protein of adaptative response / methylated-DNA-[protein]-cysteine methyltransferase